MYHCAQGDAQHRITNIRVVPLRTKGGALQSLDKRNQNTKENRIQVVDVKTVREMYGDGGFLQDQVDSEYSYINSLNVTQSEYVIPHGGFEIATIFGSLNHTSNITGIPVNINVTKPDGNIEQLISYPTGDSVFQTQFVITDDAQEGTYLIAATFLDGKSQITTFDLVSAESSLVSVQNPDEIPNWIKNEIKLWIEDKISDSDFGLAIHNLNIQEIQNDTNYENIDSVTSLKIPIWIKTTAKWWIDGHVNDEELRNAVKFLVEKGFMKI